MSADVIIYNQMYNVTLKFVNLVSLWVKVKYVQRWYVKKKKNTKQRITLWTHLAADFDFSLSALVPTVDRRGPFLIWNPFNHQGAPHA